MSRSTIQIAKVLLLCLLLVGCAGPAGRVQTPAPIEDRRPAVETPVETEPELPRNSAQTSSSSPQLAFTEDAFRPAPPSSTAVQTLLAAAMQAAARDDWDRAEAALERAIKLAPQDSSLWSQLAYTHLRQGALEEAGEIAQRALSLASTRPADKALVWRLIADIETARGNSAAANAARLEARRLVE